MTDASLCVYQSLDASAHVYVVCSDGSATETHAQDYVRRFSGTATVNDIGATNIVSMCETEVSSKCPNGWAFYSDVGGSEGFDSCVWVSSTTAASWTAASTSCTSGGHLLTVKASIAGSGLLAFATSLVAASENVYVGCSQSSSATQRGAGWTWVDGTAATNLACANGLGCGLWASSEPK